MTSDGNSTVPQYGRRPYRERPLDGNAGALRGNRDQTHTTHSSMRRWRLATTPSMACSTTPVQDSANQRSTFRRNEDLMMTRVDSRAPHSIHSTPGSHGADDPADGWPRAAALPVLVRRRRLGSPLLRRWMHPMKAALSIGSDSSW